MTCCCVSDVALDTTFFCSPVTTCSCAHILQPVIDSCGCVGVRCVCVAWIAIIAVFFVVVMYFALHIYSIYCIFTFFFKVTRELVLSLCSLPDLSCLINTTSTIICGMMKSGAWRSPKWGIPLLTFSRLKMETERSL